MLARYKLRNIIILFLIFFLAGCGANDDVNDLTEQLDEQNNKEQQSEEYTSRKPVLEGLPVYPEAQLVNEIGGSTDTWQWLYQTNGSGNEIKNFFITSLQELGFEIDFDSTIANREEFFVVTKDQTIQVYWLDTESISDIENVTADTPNRGYSIVVDLLKWETR